MGKIYLIENVISGLKYVGQTHGCVAQRFAQHIDHAYRRKKNNRNSLSGFYSDIVSSGEDVFNIFKYTIIEECNDEDLDDREKYWIKKVKPLYNWAHRKEFLFDIFAKDMCDMYLGGFTVTEIREKFQCRHTDVVWVLNQNGIEVVRSRPLLKNRKKVYHLDAYGNIIKEYNYCGECAKDLGCTRFNVRMCANNNSKIGYLFYTCCGEYLSYIKDHPYVFKLINHNTGDSMLLKTKRAVEIEVEKVLNIPVNFGRIKRGGRKTFYGIEVIDLRKEEDFDNETLGKTVNSIST